MDDSKLLLSPYLYIHINGIELDEQRYRSITSVTVNETLEGSDTCTIGITDTNGLFIEDNIFIEESTVTVEMGCNEYPNPRVFYGYISAIDPDFPESGDITLSITCTYNSHLMNRAKKTRTFENTRSIDIVKQIIGEYGFQFREGSIAHDFLLHNSISQTDTTDIDFIESLLDKETIPCFAKMVNENTFTYAVIGFQNNPVLELHYKQPPYDLISFKPTINRENLSSSSVKQEVSTTEKSLIYAFATIDTETAVTQGSKAVTTNAATGTGYNYEGIHDSGYMYERDIYSEKQRDEILQTQAEKDMMNNELLTLVGDANVMITPKTVRTYVNDTVIFWGLGKYLSGNYLIKGITRSLSGNYSLSYSLAKTGFGNSLKSSSEYTEIPNAIPESSPTSGGGSSNPDISGSSSVTFNCTAYTHTGNNTASGVYPTVNHTVAASEEYDFGTQIYIPAMNCTYTVEDRGGAITEGHLDIFMDTEDECLNFGRQYLEGYVV